MVIFKNAQQLSQYISAQKQEGISIGFVPTMGALHDGHLSLLELAVKENNLTVCSIFINPTQFNNADDFKHYPVTIERDIEKLISGGCSILFLPYQEQIYPTSYEKVVYNIGRLEHILEGAFRPGHFQGVCQAVDQLVNIVMPDVMYLGQKDWQQCMVISKLLELKNKDLKLSILPTIREKDGLAMSSRNVRLNDEQRAIAPKIYQVLQRINQNINNSTIEELIESATKELTDSGFEVDYIEIVDAKTLEPVTSLSQPKIALVAARLGAIRLIDNLPLN
ncbi:MAG TPA: pantoate--beta-alanine ligase [Flavisolibacter sp.]|nr:pantoate--beta-alanine ligase [Flavisolibacter sp.]